MKYLLIITLTLIWDCALAQPNAQTTGIPVVFTIGEYEEHYPELSDKHPLGFLALYDNDLSKAYGAWSEFLMDIEDYATALDFDLKGVRLWLKLYFNPDGSIANLAFYPKPNSRNVPEEHLVAFFKNFTRQYHFSEKGESGFQHSASASFPTFFHRTNPQTAKGN